MKAIIIYLLPVWFSLIVACTSQSPKNESVQKKINTKTITVNFIIDDSTVNISNDFRLLFVNTGDTQAAIINGNKLELPILNKDTGYTICFVYKNYSLSFSNFTKKMILPDQDIEWNIGIDNKIVNNLRGLLSAEEFKNKKKFKQLQYFQFNPIEYGDGIQFVKKIE